MTHPRWNKEDRCFVFIFREGGERETKRKYLNLGKRCPAASMTSRVYTFDTSNSWSPYCAFEWYSFITKKAYLCKSFTFEVFGVVISVERKSDSIECLLDDSLQLTTFCCPKKDTYGLETMLRLGDNIQVIGHPMGSQVPTLNAVQVTVHKAPNSECTYWLEQIQKYKSKASPPPSQLPLQPKRVSQENENTWNTSFSFSCQQLSRAATECWKVWKQHFGNRGKVSITSLWQVIDSENSPTIPKYSNYARSQILKLLIHSGYLIPIREEPENCILLTDDMLDKQIMNIFNHNVTSSALSLREVAYRLELHFGVREIRLERIEESILRLTYQEKVGQV